MPLRSQTRTRAATALSALASALVCTGCFGIIREPARHYYVLHVSPRVALAAEPLGGLLRVRDVDTATAYDRLQMVVRKSNFELAFRPRDTWAVKPGRMVSDALARALAEAAAFDGVTRELSERRPDYLLSGELHALEVEQASPRWQAHLGLSLQLTDVESGEVLWTGHYDEREPCANRDYGVVVQAMSTALDRIVGATREGLRALPPGPLHPGARVGRVGSSFSPGP